MRRIWYLLGFLILGGGVVALGYFLRPQNKNPQTYLNNTPSTTVAGGGGPQTPAGGLSDFTPVFKESVLGYLPYPGGIIAVDSGGRIISTDGKSETILSSTSIPFSFSASVSYDHNYVLIAWGGPGNEQFRVWNATKNTWKFLPSGIFSPVFSPQTRELAYLEKTPGGSRLSILNLDLAGARGRVVTTLPLESVGVFWVSRDKIELKERAALAAPSSDFIYSLSRGTISPAVVEKNGLDISWSPSGNAGLAFLGQALGGKMFLIDSSGQIIQSLNILTLPEKCAWSGEQKLYCALPQDSGVLRTALPDSFYKQSFFTQDNFYGIDAQSGNVTPIMENRGSFDAVSLVVSGGKLFFINRLDGKLYSLPIPG